MALGVEVPASKGQVGVRAVGRELQRTLERNDRLARVAGGLQGPPQAFVRIGVARLQRDRPFKVRQGPSVVAEKMVNLAKPPMELAIVDAGLQRLLAHQLRLAIVTKLLD